MFGDHFKEHCMFLQNYNIKTYLVFKGDILY